jgi:zinc transport system permease protein
VESYHSLFIKKIERRYAIPQYSKFPVRYLLLDRLSQDRSQNKPQILSRGKAVVMMDALQFEFMQNALVAGLLASLICGIMGTLVVVNRIVFLSGGIAHSAFGGIGLAFFFGWHYMVGTIGFAIVAALTMAAITLKAKHRTDTIIGVIWAVGMASGIILLDLTPGYNVDLMSYLFGSILTVPDSDIWMMLGVGLAIVGIVIYFYYDFLALSYDEEFAQIRGVHVKSLYFLMIVMLAVGIVMIIQVVGLILVIALLTIPPYIAEKYSRSLIKMMVLSSLLSAVFTVTGLWFSYELNLTSGASIILVAGIGFIVSAGIDRLLPNLSARPAK